MNDRIRNILEDLESVRENLLALSDDIWLSIEHNDPDALENGYQFKKAYNQKWAEFDHVADDLSRLIQQFTKINLTADEVTGTDDETENDRIIQELNKEVPHTLDEDFTYIRPYGFVLNGKATVGLTTWRRLYEVFCQQLANHCPERFRQLAVDPEMARRNGGRWFSTSADNHYTAWEITEGIFAEVQLSANSLRHCMKRLLKTFDIPESDMKVYFREDRDAQRETRTSD
jgi:hypothetical protein